MKKTIYHYTPAGRFLGVSEADESPLEPGVYHCPAGATFDTVPAHDQATQIAVYTPAYWPTNMPKDAGGVWRLENIEGEK